MTTPSPPSTRAVRIAIAQLCSTRNKHSNIINVAKTAGWAKHQGAKMLFLPECLGFMGDNAEHTLLNADPPIQLQMNSVDNDELQMLPMTSFREALAATIQSCSRSAEEQQDDDIDKNVFSPVTSIIAELQFIAQQSGLWISGGGIHTAAKENYYASSSLSSGSKIYNTHVIIDPRGRIGCFYHKVHLFDVSIPDKINLKESTTTAPGETLAVCDSPIGLLALTICYDVRFPEMYVDLVQRGGAEVILVPSAFTVPTGIAHWHALLKARAIESQCYVIAAAQVGRHNEKRKSYGHSLAYDPWGTLLVDAGGYDSTSADDEGADELSHLDIPSIVTCDIDLDLVSSVRERMPIQQHRSNSNFSF